MRRSWLFRSMVLLLALLLPVFCVAGALDAVGSKAEAPVEIEGEAAIEASDDFEVEQEYLTDDDLLVITPDVEGMLAGLDDIALEDGEAQPAAEEMAELDLLTEAMADPVEAPASEPESQADADPGAQVAPGLEPDADPAAEPQADPEGEPETEPQADPEGEPETEPQANPEGEPETEPQADPEGEPETEPQADPEGEPEGEPDGVPGTGTVDGAAVDPEGDPDAGDEPAPASDPKPESDADAEPASDPKPEAEPEGEAEPDAAAGESADAGADAPEAITGAPEVAEAGSFPPALLLGVKDTYRLDASSVLPGKLAYASSNAAVVSVDKDTGKLVAKAKGTAKVAAVNASRKYVICTVKVVPAPSKIAFAKTKLTINIGSTYKLPAKLPKGTAASITYSSSRAGVAKVSGSGVIRGVKAGTAVITARSHNGKTASCKVTVLAGTAPKSLSLKKTSATLGLGDKLKLKPVLNAGAAALYTWSSSNRKVATVSTKGVVTAKRTGKVKITVRTHNGLKKSCTIKVVKAPKKVTLSPAFLRIAVGGSGTLRATLPKGTAASLKWSSSAPGVAAVTGGRVVGLKAGLAKITVTTFNKKSATALVLVVADPNAVAGVTGSFEKESLSVALGRKAVIGGSVRAENTLLTGVSVTVNDTAGKLSAKLNNLSSVSLQASACGGAFVVNTAKAPFNRSGTYILRLYATESTGTAPTEVLDTLTVKVTGVDPQRMVENLRNSSYLGGKASGIASIVQLLMNNGYESTFAAGVAANVLCEGNYGYFESSRYVTYPKNRPRYFAYLDGGNYYALRNGTRVLTEVFLSKAGVAAYTGSATASVRYSTANYYLNTYSAKNAWDVNLTNLEKMLVNLKNGSWKGKFGLGVVQWTAGRTKNLVALYRKHAGSGVSGITKAQVIAAENEMILTELRSAYAYVYNSWKSGGSLTGANGAAAAAEVFCRKYEIPAGIEAAVTKRRGCAKEIYNIMMS